MAYVTPLLTGVVEAVKKSVLPLDRDFAELEQLQNSVKSIKNFVMGSYSKLEQNLKMELSKIRPDIPVFTTNNKISGHSYFAISPIEAITNFAHGNADFAVSVALIENDITVCGVIYNPAHDEMFFAQHGKGAYKEGPRNHERLRVSSVKDAQGLLVGFNADFDGTQERFLHLQENILKSTGNLRISGCLALDLAYVAAGKLDATVGLNAHFASIAAGLLMITEAGGIIRALDQKDARDTGLNDVKQTGNVVASNFAFGSKILSLLK